ncbi:zinc finger protein ENHYDROUS-like [Salvia splendens]|uniref:zinc finger protein ENHYDROUS-like n=1 Tax=Salvia splendens TaxID=180675 RepID=UPI001C260514|nr:zinc finger protein ENHYDROUS-like [Salvia splendens]
MVEMEISSPTRNGAKSEQLAEAAPPVKRRRNLPGMPDPDSEVIALSPKTLLATNRFVCEICSKGFQRDQNLQLHRRGHNLPWKLRQRTSKEVRKRVYVCPEATCVHHEPTRALGDLTGIKKHFCRKHGEKKYKCERCSKKYAVQSDCKAHMKTCGSREYRCDCGTLFSRRDSFITHRAFCDALALEISRPQPDIKGGGDVEPSPPPPAASSPPQPPLTPSTLVLSPVLSIQSSAGLPENHQTIHLQPPPSTAPTTTAAAVPSSSSASSSHIPPNGGVMPIMLNASTPPAFSSPAISLSLSSLFQSPSQNPPRSHYAAAHQPALSATALLQKAAQMGSTSSKSSLLHGLWLSGPTPSDSPTPDNDCIKLESSSLASGLGLSPGASGFTELMISPPTTLDFLGLGMPAGEAPSDGFSAFFSSIGGRLHHMPPPAAPFAPVRAAGDTWDEAQDRKPSML